MKKNVQAEKGLSHKIIRNTIYNSVGRFWGMLVSLVLTPYIISRIGIERFGIWSVIGIITTYFGLLDFGVGASFTKFIAQFYAKKEFDKVNEVINTGFAFYGIFAAIVIILSIICTRPVLVFFKIPIGLYNEAAFVFIIGMAIFALSNAASPFFALQTGLQRMDVANSIAIVSSVLNIAGTVFFLEKGYGLPGLMVNNAIIFLISTAMSLAFTYRLFPQWRFGIRFINIRVFVKLFKYGYKLQVSRLANLISFQADKVIIGYFLNMSMVTFYQLGSSLLQSLRQLPLLLISALIPAVSEVDAQNDKKTMESIFVRGSKYLIIAATPLTAFVIVTAPLILTVWMGRGYDLTTIVIRVLAVGYYAATVTGVGSAISSGVGRTDIDMKFGTVMAITNISLSVILIIKFGFLGAVFGTALSLFAASIYFVVLFHRYFGWQYFRPYARLFIKPLYVSAIAALVVWLPSHFFFLSSGLPGRAFGFVVLGIQFGLFITVYGVLIMLGGYVDDTDRELIISRAPILKNIVRKAS